MIEDLKCNKELIALTTILRWCSLVNRSIKPIFTEIILAIKDLLMNENALFYSKLHYASHYHHNSLFFSNLKINGPEKNYDCIGCNAQGEIYSPSILQISFVWFYLFWWCSFTTSCLQNIKPVMVLGNIFKLNHICYPSLLDIFLPHIK